MMTQYSPTTEQTIQRMVMLAFLYNKMIRLHPIQAKEHDFIFGKMNDMLTKDDQLGVSGEEMEMLHKGSIQVNELISRIRNV